MSGEHYKYLDGWRGLSISLVLIGHFFPVPGINLGSVGVNLFFVLSGLLMARLLFVDEVPLSLFYKRRISRIFPAFFLFLSAVVVFSIVTGRDVQWWEVGTAALFVKNYFPGESGVAVMPLGHIWSLSVEEHAYILLSTVAALSRRKRLSATRALAGFSGLFVLIGLWYSMRYGGRELNFDKWLHSEVSAFGICLSAFMLMYFRKRGVPKLPLIAYPALVLLGIALHWWSVPTPIRTFVGVSAFALTVNLLCGAPSLIQRILSFPPLCQLGVWSYSIYLWQQPFYLWVHRDGLNSWLGLSISVVAGIASFYVIEKPARGYLNNVLTKGKPPHVAIPDTQKI